MSSASKARKENIHRPLLSGKNRSLAIETMWNVCTGMKNALVECVHRYGEWPCGMYAQVLRKALGNVWTAMEKAIEDWMHRY